MVVTFFVFFFQAEDGIRDGTVTGVQTCALPISECRCRCRDRQRIGRAFRSPGPTSDRRSSAGSRRDAGCSRMRLARSRSARPALSRDRKSTRLNSSHSSISYAVFCLKKKTGLRMVGLARTRWLALAAALQLLRDGVVVPPLLLLCLGFLLGRGRGVVPAGLVPRPRDR